MTVFAIAGCETAPPAAADPPDPASTAPARPAAWGPWREVWRYAAGGDITAPPAADAERIYCASWDHRLAALDRATGRRQWQIELTARTLAPPVLAGGLLADLNAHQTLYLVDPAAGRILHELKTGWWFPRQAPVFAGDRIAAVSEKGQVSVWRTAAEGAHAAGRECWTVELDAPPVGPPMAVGETLWTCDRHKGVRGWALADGSPRPDPFGVTEYPHAAVASGRNAIVAYAASLRWFDLGAGTVGESRRLGAAYPTPVALKGDGEGGAVVWCGKSWVLWVAPGQHGDWSGIESLAIEEPPAWRSPAEGETAGPAEFAWSPDGADGVLWAVASEKGGAVRHVWRPSCGPAAAPQRIEFDSPVTMIDRPAPDLMLVGLQNGMLAAFVRERTPPGEAPAR